MKINVLKTSQCQHIMNTFHVSNLAAQVLAAKQLEDCEIAALLEVDYDLQTLDLTFMNDIVSRIRSAKQNDEKVMICGDYDCDGICATTILYDTLQMMGIEVGYYIPNRFMDGYGVSEQTVQKAYDKGYTLLITVDNGVGAKTALQKAKQLGMDVILSDHHSYESSSLVYDYFLHPAILPAQYAGMCGAGMALLMSLACVGVQEKHLILAGIATIADIVPLLQLNRSLVHQTITLLNQNHLPAIQMLANDKNKWDTMKIAFQVVPKINCVGRLADIANVNQIVKFLLHSDQTLQLQYAKQLNELNEKRKHISEVMTTQALSQMGDDPFLVLYDERFHEGINGIVASKIAKQTGKPTMVLSLNKGHLKGSIRSDSIDLTTYFERCDCLNSYGGHKEAAGISFDVAHLAQVKQYANGNMEDNMQTSIDVISLDGEKASVEEVSSLTKLAPFGCGFSAPIFMISTTINKVTLLSDGKHVKYNAQSIEFLKFNCNEQEKSIKVGQNVQFIGTLLVNEFRYKKTVNMLVDYIVT